jgi:hypothetical protein
MIDQPSPWPPPPVPPPTDAPPSSARTVLAAAAGFVLAALIALVLALTGVLPGKDEAGASAASISLPRSFAGHVALSMTTQAQANPNTTRALNAYDRYYATHTGAALRTAYHGAGAAVFVYYGRTDLSILRVWVVRAHTPPPVLPYQDPRYLGLAAPVREVMRIGQVYCDVQRQPVPAGKQVPTEGVYVGSCQRTSSSLTVWIMPGGSEQVGHHPGAIARLVNQMWNAVA